MPRRSVTIGLYLLMFATTLTGWALAGTVRTPLNKDAFGLTVPLIYTSQDRAMHGLFEDIAHDPGLHARRRWWSCISSAALRHHFVKRNNVLRRMWFGKGS